MHSLWNPNHLQHNWIEYWDNPYNKQQQQRSIVTDDIQIPLQLNGTKHTCGTRVPTNTEL